jgi:gliding motility-associated-like protein
MRHTNTLTIRGNNWFTKAGIVLLASLSISVHGRTQQHSKGYNTNATNKWTTNAFDNKLFVENKGQFDNDIQGNNKVLYEASFGLVQAYFTATGITYRYEELAKRSGADENKDPDEIDQKPVIHYLTEKWINSNPDVTIEAGDEQSYYYNYPVVPDGTIKTNVFKKLVYHNLYPGIDAQYVFPKGKPGMKYSLIVHPGANVSVIKFAYEGADKIYTDANGNLVINTSLGIFTEHAPASYYKGKGKINSSFILDGNTASFSVNNANNNALLVIDPWVTSTTFSTAPNRAYDVDYDNLGNVYVYGGGGPYQLVKLNSAGAIQWTFNNTFFWGREHYYGDFTVDKVTGTSYVVEGVGGPGFGTPADAMKVNTLGVLKATFTGNAHLTEMWRAIYNSCTHTIVIGGGGISYPYQSCVLDTNMKTITPVNVLTGDTMPYHDITLMAMDPAGQNCYMTTALNVFYDTNYDNFFLKVPVPALSPTTYMHPDGYQFQETNSVWYVGQSASAGYALANAMNGMGVSNNWVYTYEGYIIHRYNPLTGALTKSLTIAPPVIKTYYGKPAMVPGWGGLDVDMCDNLYVGDVSTINIYDSTLTQTGSITAADTIYDIVLGANYTTLYSCGVGFVSSMAVTSTLNPTVTVTKTPGCSCNASATATLKLCGNPVTTATYLWSNGATTQTASALCPGTYTVTISPTCDMFFKDSVTILGTSLNPSISGNDTICQGQNTTLFATGGGTYTWSTGATSTSITVTPVSDSLYYLVATDTSGCKDTVKEIVKVNPKPKGTVTGPFNICKGDSAHLLATGGTTYIWKPATGLSASNIANPTAYPSTSTTYSVFISNGNCWDTIGTAVTINPPPAIATCCNDTISAGDTVTIHVVPVTAGDTYSWVPSSGLSCTTCPNPIASPNVPTTYYVLLTDSNGCTVLDSVEIFVKNCANIWIPNAFTPNGDGLNDYFYPKGGSCLKTIEMYIFDRWGQIISHTINTPWDGRDKGDKVEEDTYVYLIITTDVYSKTHNYMGRVSVIR